MRQLQINWLRKCRICGNKKHTVFTIKGVFDRLYEDDDVECNECGLKGIIHVEDGIAGVIWETDEERLQ